MLLVGHREEYVNKSREAVSEFEASGAAAEEIQGLRNPMTDVFARIQEIQQNIGRSKKEIPEDDSSSGKPLGLRGSNVVRLPVWPEPVRGVPNGMLRSSLFGAIQKGPRRYMEGEEIAAQDGIEIRYTGQRLDQGDLDVWESILHVCRFQDMGSQCRFTAYAMLKLLGMTACGKNRETLHKRVMRLKANGVEVQQGRYTYIGSLLDEAYKDEDTHEYVVVINAKLRPLFAADQFTQIDWNVRHALAGQPLAQWLHGYYASHAQPYPVKIKTLLELSGSENEAARSSNQKLRKALDSLTVASNANKQPFNYEIHDDLVYVERKASSTQRRHLAKKATCRLPRSKS